MLIRLKISQGCEPWTLVAVDKALPMVQDYHHLLHRHPGSLSFFEREPFRLLTVVTDVIVKTPHGSLSSPPKPLTPFCSRCLIGRVSRLPIQTPGKAWVSRNKLSTIYSQFVKSLNPFFFLFVFCSVVLLYLVWAAERSGVPYTRVSPSPSKGQFLQPVLPQTTPAPRTKH